MNKNFGSKSIAIQYIQKIISEKYNDKVIVNGEYYTVFDSNYGFAHYVARYLDYTYPVLDPTTKQAYDNAKINNDLTSVRELYEPISITNYFLCSSNGGKLSYYPENDINPEMNKVYNNIYNYDMCLSEIDGILVPNNNDIMKRNENDLPILVYKQDDTYYISNNSNYTLKSWVKEKKICEIDDLVASFLLGHVIGPNSSKEDIAYAQRLLIRDRNIEERELGNWKIYDPYNPDMYDMTKTVMRYQSSIASNSSVPNVFVTGYFDIFTESCALRENGVEYNGILGL